MASGGPESQCYNLVIHSSWLEQKVRGEADSFSQDRFLATV